MRYSPGKLRRLFVNSEGQLWIPRPLLIASNRVTPLVAAVEDCGRARSDAPRFKQNSEH